MESFSKYLRAERDQIGLGAFGALAASAERFQGVLCPWPSRRQKINTLSAEQGCFRGLLAAVTEDRASINDIENIKRGFNYVSI